VKPFILAISNTLTVLSLTNRKFDLYFELIANRKKNKTLWFGQSVPLFKHIFVLQIFSLFKLYSFLIACFAHVHNDV